ncbi:MAG: hypothetical protein ACM3PY_00405 [Omnitrophica WOR_2 bacterium]
MRSYVGKVTEIRLEASGELAAQVSCLPSAVPAPGQYLLARLSTDRDAALGLPLFLSEEIPAGFQTSPPIPSSWTPGVSLSLYGPLGRGFRLPAHTRRLVLAAVGNTASRLWALAPAALEKEAAVAFFSDTALPKLPASIEAYPLAALPEALSWADFLAVDLPAGKLSELRTCLGLKTGEHLNCPAQALVTIPMPCAGMADCGACAAPVRHGWKLACKDGPVFDLKDLDW